MKIKNLKCDKKIDYNEWRMVLNPKSMKGNKISRKVPVSKKFCRFVIILSRELNKLKQHLKRVHTQYKAFKVAREEAVSEEDIVTVQIDWSENVKMRQARLYLNYLFN